MTSGLLVVLSRVGDTSSVFQDMFTKWPMVFLVPDQKSERLLCEEIVPLFGVPEALLSDHGTNLLSHLMLDVCALLGTTKLNITAYHSECDGMAPTELWKLTTLISLHRKCTSLGMTQSRCTRKESNHV